MPDFVARCRAIAIAALASLPVSMASAPALAIPEEAAMKKLAVIPVFFHLTDTILLVSCQRMPGTLRNRMQHEYSWCVSKTKF